MNATNASMDALARGTALGLAGFCTFLNLYSPQALLPSLAAEFGASAAAISATMTAGTLAVALTAPFSGAAADVIGRKRVIITAMLVLVMPTLMIAFAPDVPSLVFWRFVQGLTLPPIFVVMVAYIGDEWPAADVARMAGIYTSGASLGGFAGRFLTGSLADLMGWRNAHIALALITLASALATAALLPRERRFVRSESLAASLRQMLRHLRNPQLLATYAVGFGVLFNFIATFTYVNFVLAGPPYGFTATMLGTVFVIYLVGAAVAPLSGRLVHRFERRPFMLANFSVWACGITLTLIPSLWSILAGLTLCAVCGIVAQAITTGTVTMTAQEGRSSAVGLYVTCFYIGGSFGAFLPGLAWDIAGWPGCVAMVVAMLAVMASIVALVWPERARKS